MSKLVQMRNRIKSINTIRKITHAMRLVAMSTHATLKQKKFNLIEYSKVFKDLYSKIFPNETTCEIDNTQITDLIILIGSQKGLCGNFNNSIFKFFSNNKDNTPLIITIGRNSTDYIISLGIKPIAYFNEFSNLNFVSISSSITKILLSENTNFKKISIFSNFSKGFFIQTPIKTVLKIPQVINNNFENNEYIIDNKSNMDGLCNTIAKMIVKITLQEILFESLIAEQAARFVSMDSATRNADKALEQTKIEYNKIRQSEITKELTELASGF